MPAIDTCQIEKHNSAGDQQNGKRGRLKPVNQDNPFSETFDSSLFHD
jgi:hypothetical protein